MTSGHRSGPIWRRHRAAFLTAGILAWVALISMLHTRGIWGGGTAKGATELLQIGALPVT